MTQAQQLLQSLFMQLLPADHSAVGNISLLAQFQAAVQAASLPAISEDDFTAVRDVLLASGQIVKGRGRGGSTARATGASRPDFELKAEPVTIDLLANPAAANVGKTAIKPKAALKADAAPGEPQVISYRHPDRRKNNPEVGLVNEASDPEQAKTPWAYDPHLDPALQFDSARAGAEKLIEDALAGNDPAAMRHALEELRRRSAPYLQWTGKAERTSFEVDTVSLHVHERIDAMSILSAVSKRQSHKDKAATGGFQPGLFEAPFESLPLRSAVDFYKHERGWANRLVAGDSLLVMNSLLQKEGMAGQVQMIYIDPPYGIKYGSNFQPFTNKRDVKDRSDADLTQEPEMIKAFRDTWELGIHSYLTYLRDRLLLAKDLLSEMGSVFVQISDENLHHVRELCDEVFGSENFVGLITFNKTTGAGSPAIGTLVLASVCDYVVWYCKDRTQVKYRQLYSEKTLETDVSNKYSQCVLETGKRESLNSVLSKHEGVLPKEARIYRLDNTTSQGSPPTNFSAWGETYTGGWKTNEIGLDRLQKANRLSPSKTIINYIRYLNDFTVAPLNNIWGDVGGIQSRLDSKIYVVQTNTKAIERCMLMTSDPGDLVLDPTCGSGSTAFVAEKWGRRWMTCDTSRVAITLAKQRLMTASFDYFALRYPHEGLKGGFIYKTVPHVTLKSIANNPEIDAIYERQHPGIAAALAGLNAALAATPPAGPFAVTEGARKGQKLALGKKGVALLEWEVPFDYPAEWPADRKNVPETALSGPVVQAFNAFHAARQKMQAEMDRSIAAQADNETLYDQPEKTKNKLRVTGPFTVEAVPFPAVLSLDEHAMQAPQEQEADLAIARTGITSRQHAWRDELLKAGIRGKGGQMLKFAELEVLPGTTCLHASGHLDSGERVVISFGPEHGALEQRQVEHALGEAGDLFPRPKMIVFCAFAFDPEAAKDIDALKGITALKAQMNTDMLTEDLKKAKSTNQSFWLMGQPDVQLSQTKDGLWRVEVNGFDYFDTAKGELVSGGKGKIAAWSLDTDYDGRSLFPHQFFFPMAGKDEGWMKLKKDIRAELDEDLLKHFVGTVSLPFAAGANNTVAVKIVDDRGIESLKVMKLVASSAAV